MWRYVLLSIISFYFISSLSEHLLAFLSLVFYFIKILIRTTSELSQLMSSYDEELEFISDKVIRSKALIMMFIQVFSARNAGGTIIILNHSALVISGPFHTKLHKFGSGVFAQKMDKMFSVHAFVFVSFSIILSSNVLKNSKRKRSLDILVARVLVLLTSDRK